MCFCVSILPKKSDKPPQIRLRMFLVGHYESTGRAIALLLVLAMTLEVASSLEKCLVFTYSFSLGWAMPGRLAVLYMDRCCFFTCLDVQILELGYCTALPLAVTDF